MRKSLLLIFCAALVGTFVYGASYAKDDDIIGGEKGSKKEIKDDSGAAPDKKKEDAKKKKDKKEADADDIIFVDKTYELPKALSPIPRLKMKEAQDAPEIPKPLMNIAPPDFKAKKQAAPKIDENKTETGGVKKDDAQKKNKEALNFDEPAGEELPLDLKPKGSIIGGSDKKEAAGGSDKKASETPKDEDASEESTEESATPVVNIEQPYPLPFEDSVKPVKVITFDEIKKRNAQSLSDALLEQPELYLNYMAPAINSPVMRGLGATHVQILVDGIRLNSPAFFPYGFGALIDAFEPEFVESVEIYAGSNSSYIGQGSAGGTIQINLAQAQEKDGQVGGRASLKLNTSKAGGSLNALLSSATGRTKWLIGAGLASYDDVSGGRRQGYLHSTEYGEYQAALKLSFEFDKNAVATFGAYYHRFDDAEVNPAVHYGLNVSDEFSPMDMMVVYLAYEHKDIAFFLPYLKAQLSLASFAMEREYAATDSSAWMSRENNNLLSIGAGLTLGLPYGFNFGFSYYRDIIDKATVDVSPRLAAGANAGDAPWEFPLLPDGGTYQTISLFLGGSYTFLNALNVNAAARYDFFNINADWQTTDYTGAVKQLSVDYNTQAFTAGGGLAYSALSKMITVSLNAHQGLRAPTMSELTYFGPAQFYGRKIWMRPSITDEINLKPEKNFTVDLGVKVNAEFVYLNAFYYVTYRDDMIQLGDFLPAKDLPFDYSASYKNAGHAYIQGVETELKFNFQFVELKGTYAYAYAKNDRDEPLANIPPHHGGLFLRYNFLNAKAFAEGYMLWATSQDRLSTVEKIDFDKYFTDPDGTDGYYTVNFRVGMKLGGWAEINAGITNLLDRNYKLHGSGMNMPGRSFNLRVSAWF